MTTKPRFQFPDTDPFDTSTNDEKFDKDGLPTVEKVDELESTAKTLFQLEKGQKAADALDLFAKQANMLSNVIGATLKPFYGADHDERGQYPDLHVLAKLETMSNDYKVKRNRAMVMRAECLLSLGRTADAVGLLMNALELISFGETKWWKRAREDLLKAVGVP